MFRILSKMIIFSFLILTNSHPLNRMVTMLAFMLMADDRTFANTIHNNNDNKLQQLMVNLSEQFEKFNFAYLASLEQKLTTIINSIAIFDASVKTLQERTHVLNIFQHHIQAWTDTMKSVDHKVDLIKLTQEETKSLESKIDGLKFAINHVITKVDLLSEKHQDLNPTTAKKIDDIYKIVNNHERDTGYERREMLIKLNGIMRHVLSIENRGVRESRHTTNAKSISNEDVCQYNRLESVERKVDKVLEEISGVHDIVEIVTYQKKNSEVIANTLELAQSIDERTIRLYNSEAQHSSKLISCCRTSADELITFTASSDLLLKNIEKLVLNLQEEMGRLTKKTKQDKASNSEENKEIQGSDESTKSPDVENKNNKDTMVTKVYRNEVESLKNETELFKGNVTRDNETGKIAFNETGGISSPIHEEAYKAGCHELEERNEGVYQFGIAASGDDRDFNKRFCAFPTDGLGWTVIQRRGPYDIQENFNRSWNEYKTGFGDLQFDFWFGNEFLHRILYKDNHELRIEMEDFDGIQVWAEYSTFQIDPEKYNYKLMIGGYRGSVTDSMLYHHDMDFSTYDRQNDRAVDECCPCAVGYGSGWWFDNCLEANLNGIYRGNPKGHKNIGIIWEHWHGDYSIKRTRMLIRPKNIWSEGGEDDLFSEMAPEDP